MPETEADALKDGQTARDLALGVLDEAETCTLATATPDGTPEAATVRFVADDQYTISINTATTYRKYENLTANPRVAIVVDGDRENVQLEGTARELEGPAVTGVHERYAAKYGQSDYLTNEHSTCFEIDPDWARLLYDGGFPPDYAMLVGDGRTEVH
jgi:pyridoxine/pyridoxamine 5'-phosphate oxidase